MSDEFQWPIYGHKNQINFLQGIIKKQQFSNAYLFYGARGLGKKYTANFFVQSIFCEENKKPCQKCKTCRMIKNRSFADFYYLGEKQDDLSVDSIRNFLQKLSLTSSSNTRKIAVIARADKLNLHAANALLKTLEEPPKNTSIILISDSIERLPSTVISRCLLLKFQPLLREDMELWLKNYDFKKEEADTIINLSFGRPGLAMKFIHDNMENYNKTCNFIIKLLSSTTFYYMQTIDKWFDVLKKEYPGYKMYELGELTKDHLDLVELILRDMLWIKFDRPVVNKVFEKELKNISTNFDKEKIMDSLFSIDDLREQINMNVSPQLLWENLFLKIK